LWGIVAFPAFPAVVLVHEKYLFGVALRADDAIGPPLGHEVIPAVFRAGKVDDRLLKSGWFVGAFHTSGLA
jgi:hypothetical protein